MKRGVHTIVSCALMCATLGLGTLGAPGIARADIIAPHEVPMRMVGIRRPSRYSSPEWRCREEALKEMREAAKGQAQIGSGDPKNNPKYKACMARSADAIKAYEAEQARYEALSTAFTIVVFVLIPMAIGAGLLMFWRRRKARIAAMEDADLPTPEGDGDDDGDDSAGARS